MDKSKSAWSARWRSPKERLSPASPPTFDRNAGEASDERHVPIVERLRHQPRITDPASAEGLIARAADLLRKGLWGKAIPELRRALELTDDQTAAYVLLGEALNCTDDLEGALEAFQRAVELSPNDPRALRGLAIIYDRLGRSDEAVLMYKRSHEFARR